MYQLGVSDMDQTHLEFIDLVNQLGLAQEQNFVVLFSQLLEHTENHFSSEMQLMQETGFAAIREHTDEHLRVLGEMQRIGKKVASGSTMLAKAYVTQQLPQWFHLHAITMDSALAAHIKARSVAPGDISGDLSFDITGQG
jgi:hemerythrin-like metal-binding protein